MQARHAAGPGNLRADRPRDRAAVNGYITTDIPADGRVRPGPGRPPGGSDTIHDMKSGVLRPVRSARGRRRPRGRATDAVGRPGARARAGGIGQSRGPRRPEAEAGVRAPLHGPSRAEESRSRDRCGRRCRGGRPGRDPLQARRRGLDRPVRVRAIRRLRRVRLRAGEGLRADPGRHVVRGRRHAAALGGACPPGDAPAQRPDVQARATRC